MAISLISHNHVAPAGVAVPAFDINFDNIFISSNGFYEGV